MKMLDHLKYPPTRSYDKTALMRTHLEWFYCAKAIAQVMGTDFSDLARKALQAFLPEAYGALSEDRQARAESLFIELMGTGKLKEVFRPDDGLSEFYRGLSDCRDNGVAGSCSCEKCNPAPKSVTEEAIPY